ELLGCQHRLARRAQNGPVVAHFETLAAKQASLRTGFRAIGAIDEGIDCCGAGALGSHEVLVRGVAGVGCYLELGSRSNARLGERSTREIEHFTELAVVVRRVVDEHRDDEALSHTSRCDGQTMPRQSSAA